jgi:hypothetical protein
MLVVLFQVLAALAILAVCSFAPGFYLVRRTRWSGLEKLCGSVALSLTLLWLASWTVYVAAPGAETVVYPLITIACVALGISARKDAAALFRGVRVRRALAGYGFLLLWTLVLLGIIRNYSGAGWRGDWLEHFQRSLFFLRHFPLQIEIYGNYQLPARPPAMNVFAAFVMAQAGDRFEVFQVVFAFLNLLVFLPCALALPLLARPRRPGVVPLVGLFAMSPVLMQNATYTWTKALPAFFVIFALLLYLKAWRKRDNLRMVSAFLVLAMGTLTHYSTGPYVAFLALHYLVFVFWKRPVKWKELALIGGLSTALLLSWFGWSLAVYGAKTTFESNTSVTTSRQFEGHNLEKIADNLRDSTIPALLRDPNMVNAFKQPNFMGQLRDQAFVIYQLNLIFCMGALGGFVAFALAAITLTRRLGVPGERLFWIALIVWSVLVGIAVVGERDPLGVAHLTLVPMALLGLTLIASRFAASKVLAVVVLFGCLIDFTFGVYLHARVQHLENTPDRPVFLGLIFQRGRFRTGLVSEDSLSPMAWDNWLHKHEYRLAQDWGRDVDAFHPGDPAVDRARGDAHRILERMKQDDARLFLGWFQRNGGETTFLGDAFGNSDAMSAVLLLLAAGLLVQMARTAFVRHAKPAPVARPAVVPVAAKVPPKRVRR